MIESNTGPVDRLALAADIVAAYVSKNSLPVGELPALIQAVHSALANLGGAQAGASPPMAEAREPAVSIRKSLTPEYLVCLEDGKHFKSLKRHLGTDHNLTPEQYRQKWKLPADYPMVAPAYAARRSELAKKIGLGQKATGRRRGRPPKAATPD